MSNVQVGPLGRPVGRAVESCARSAGRIAKLASEASASVRTSRMTAPRFEKGGDAAGDDNLGALGNSVAERRRARGGRSPSSSRDGGVQLDSYPRRTRAFAGQGSSAG